MENTNHQLAYQFWNAHFPELEDTLLTERQALDDDFWGKLQTALEASDPDTLWAIILTNLPMQVEVVGMHQRIATTTKRIWHKKSK